MRRLSQALSPRSRIVIELLITGLVGIVIVIVIVTSAQQQKSDGY